MHVDYGGKAWERYALLCRPPDMPHVERVGVAGTCEARALHGRCAEACGADFAVFARH